MSDKDQAQSELEKTSQTQDTYNAEDGEDAITPSEENEDDEGEDGEATSFDQSLLDIEETKKESPGEKGTEQAKLQLDTWYNRIVSEKQDDEGNLYTLEHPKMPKWVKETIEKRLGVNEIKEKQQNVSKEEILSEVRFDLLKSRIPALPNSKQAKIQEKYKKYRSLGMNKENALKESLEILNIELDSEYRAFNRIARSAPPDGYPVMRKKKDTKENMPDSARELGRKMGITDEDMKKYSKSKK